MTLIGVFLVILLVFMGGVGLVSSALARWNHLPLCNKPKNRVCEFRDWEGHCCYRLDCSYKGNEEDNT